MTRAGLAPERRATSAIRVSEKPRSPISSAAACSICSRRWSGASFAAGADDSTGDTTDSNSSARYGPSLPPTPCRADYHRPRLNSQSTVRKGGMSVSAPDAVRAMLDARSVAVVGASPRRGTFGDRLVTEVLRSPARPKVSLVNPRYAEIAGQPCHGSLADLSEPVDLVLLGVPDTALDEQLELAAARGDRAAVVFGAAWSPPAPGPT